MQRRQFLKTARDLTIGGLAALVSTTSCSLKSDEEQIKELLLESANVFQRIGDGSLSEKDTEKFMKYFKDHITEEFARREKLPEPLVSYTIITQSGLTKINNKWKIEDITSKDLIIKHPFCYGHYLMSPFIKID